MNKLWEYEGYPDSVEDYRRFPIWLMGEEGEVYVPVEITDPLIYDDDDVEFIDAMFVYCTVRLRDDTRLEGLVYLSQMYNPGCKREYGLEVFYEGEKLFISPNTTRTDNDSPEEFAQRLGKTLDSMSPLTWETPYRIRWFLRWNPDWGPNGISAECPLSGQLDLLIW